MEGRKMVGELFKWAKTPQGKDCHDAEILKNTGQAKYLKNRLGSAFYAGIRAGEGIDDEVTPGLVCDESLIPEVAIAQEIVEERRRQIGDEGFDEKHDDRHRGGVMGLAAACYASPKELYVKTGNDRTITFKDAWPWERHWDKRGKHSVRRRLVIAAALIMADIERMDRRDEANEKNRSIGRGK